VTRGTVHETPSNAGQGGSSRERPLRILLIAYEFPPSPSPQSLRWAYLGNRLAGMGHEIHVLAPDIGGSMEGLPEPASGVHVHRTWPGPVRALLGFLARRRPAASAVASPGSATSRAESREPTTGLDLPPPAEPPRLNWKGRLLEHLQAAISGLLFPDLRGEWERPRRKALHRLLDELQPDVVVSSHEPATTLKLGLEAKRRGFHWVADLGDPVLAGYTPRRWRGRSASLEAAVVREADHVLVTAVQARELFRERYGGAAQITVVTQGFDEQFAGSDARMSAPDPAASLELLYAGSFYSFRDPQALVEAVLVVPGVRLNIASGNVPEWLVAAAREHAMQVRLLGRIPHRRLLDVQREVDVLVNLANEDPSQVPGKFYEYLGAGRPVLHILAGAQLDATGALVGQLGRGWACGGGRDSIAAELARIAERHRRGELWTGLDLEPGPVTPWSWTSSARAAAAALKDVVAPT